MDIRCGAWATRSRSNGRANAGLPEPSFERFTPVEQKLNAPERSFTVTLPRSGMTLNISENESIADVLDAHEVFVPTSCRAGICGSRETRVIAGKIDHGTRLSALTRSNAMKL